MLYKIQDARNKMQKKIKTQETKFKIGVCNLKFVSFLFLVACFLFLTSPVFAQEEPTYKHYPPYFVETWNITSYYDTNLAERRFAKIIGRSESKFGGNISTFPLQVYGVYYGVLSQDENYWNNLVYYGGGTRIFPFRDFEPTNWANEWLPNMRFFAEYLRPLYFSDKETATAANLLTSDRRYGLEIWHEWNLDEPDGTKPWAELWTNLSYRTTNFGDAEFNDYILYFQPKLGVHLGGGLEGYLRSDVVYSGKEEADFYFLNMAATGVGIRFHPWRYKEHEEGLLKEFRMFAEVLSVSYLKDEPANSANQVSQDVRFGVEFSYGR